MKKKLGFSLIELLVVITIIGVLTSISIPTFTSWRNKSDYRQTIEKIVSLMNTARINSQSEKECVFSDTSKGSWMIQIEFSKVSLGCYSLTDPEPKFEELTNFNYEFDLDFVEEKKMFFNNVESFNWGSGNSIEVANETPIRFMWSKDENNFEQVSIYSQIAGRTDNGSTAKREDIDLIPVNEISINYIYTPEPSFTKPICLNRIAGYPYVSKEIYNSNDSSSDPTNPNILCVE